MFRFSVFQGQWPSEITFLEVPTYVGEVHTDIHNVCVCVREKTKKRERLHQSKVGV